MKIRLQAALVPALALIFAGFLVLAFAAGVQSGADPAAVLVFNFYTVAVSAIAIGGIMHTSTTSTEKRRKTGKILAVSGTLLLAYLLIITAAALR